MSSCQRAPLAHQHNPAEMSPASSVMLWPCSPALSNEAQEELLTALKKLCQQFAQEGRLAISETACEANGAIIRLAWDGAGALSGCSQDRLVKLMQWAEERFNVSIISAPPILIELDGRAYSVSRKELKVLVEEGRVNLESKAWNLRIQNLAEWREQGYSAAQDFWLGQIIGLYTAA